MPGYVADSIYLLLALLAAVIAIRILVGDQLRIAALQIGLLTIAFRAIIWQTLPVYGQDSLYHQGIIGNIAVTGHVSQGLESYYRQYPGAHSFSAVVQILADVPTETAFFLGVGLAHVFSLAFIYLLVRRIFGRRRIALLAALTVALSGGHLHLGTELYAQTLANALLPVFLFLFYISGDRRAIPLVLLLGAVTVVTHNLIPIILVAVGGTLLACKWLLDRLDLEEGSLRDNLSTAPTTAALSLLAVGTVSYWAVTDYLSYQVNRIRSILDIADLRGDDEIPAEPDLAPGVTPAGDGGETLTGTPAGDQSAPPSGGETPVAGEPSTPVNTGKTPTGGINDSAGVADLSELGGIPTVSLFDVELPGILMWAAPFLFLGIVVTLAGFLITRDLVDERQLPSRWVLTGLVFFGIFSVALASGGLGAVSRADAAIAVITAPLLGYVYARLVDSSWTGRGIAVALVFLCVVAGTLTPPVAMSERTDTSFEPLATSQEVRAVDFAQTYTENTTTDTYLASFGRERQVQRGERPSEVLSATFDDTQIEESRERYRSYRRNSTAPLLYRPYFDEYYGVQRPTDKHKVYSAGETEIFR